MRRLILAACAIACAAAALAGPVQSAIAASNSNTAHECQNGGYVNFVRAEGSIFKNVGDCVSYFVLKK